MFPKSLELSGYKYGLELSCIVSQEVSLWYSLVLIAESIKSLSCPEDVGKLPNLVKYYLGLLSLLFLCSYLVGYTQAAYVSVWWIPQVVVAPRATRLGWDHDVDNVRENF